MNKHEYLKGDEILSPNQSKVIEQVKLTYYPLGKALETQWKTIED